MSETLEKKYIYIVAVRENTGVAKLARAVLKYEYSHIALCMDESLTDFITFSRRKYNLPLDSGFMRETRNCFGDIDAPEFKAKVFKIEITEDEYSEIEDLIYEIEHDKEYMFNVLSMITMPIFKGFELYKTHNCLSFIGKILSKVATIELDKPFYKYSIEDFDTLLTEYTHFEGMIKKDDRHADGYMDKCGFLMNLRVGTKTLGTLFLRLFKKRHQAI